MRKIIVFWLLGFVSSCCTQTTAVRWRMPDGKQGEAEITTSDKIYPKGLLIRELLKDDGSKEISLIIQTCHFPKETVENITAVVNAKVKGIADAKSEFKKEIKEILKDTEVSVTIARLLPAICEMLVNSGQEVNLKDIECMLKEVLSGVKNAYGVEGELTKEPGKTPCDDDSGCENGQKCEEGYCR